jgi:hypothetical protein
MASRGQTHNKRARDTALREKRERKQLKKDQRAVGQAPAVEDLLESGAESAGEESADVEQTVAEATHLAESLEQ